MDRHYELEFKFLADHVDPGAFKSWCMSLGPTRFNSAAFPDVYWRRGDNVVRHRLLWGGAGELTVKRRKSADSITDRQEIDLRFSPETTPQDVSAFLLAAGWALEFTLQKHFSYPFWFKHGDASIVVLVTGEVAPLNELRAAARRFAVGTRVAVVRVGPQRAGFRLVENLLLIDLETLSELPSVVNVVVNA